METILTIEQVNELCDYVYAEPNDICYNINDTICVCNVDNDCNNIAVETLVPHATTARDVLKFIYILYTEHNINYISVREVYTWPMINRYKHFTSHNNIKYFKISENLEQLIKEAKIVY